VGLFDTFYSAVRGASLVALREDRERRLEWELGMADNGTSSRLSSIDSRKAGLQPGAQYVLLTGEERSPVVRISSLLGR